MGDERNVWLLAEREAKAKRAMCGQVTGQAIRQRFDIIDFFVICVLLRVAERVNDPINDLIRHTVSVLRFRHLFLGADI